MLKPSITLMFLMTLCHSCYASDWIVQDRLIRTNRLLEQVVILQCLQIPRCVVDPRLLNSKGYYAIQMDGDGHIKGRGD